MKKSIFAVLIALSSALQPNIASNHTYLRARDSLSNNLILTRCGTAYGSLTQKNRIGSTLSIAPYYRSAHNTKGIAQNFGGGQAINGDQDGTFVVEPGQSSTTQYEAYKLYSAALDHTSAAYAASTAEAARGMSGTVTLNPTRTEVGAHIHWQQKLNFLSPSLSLVIDMPIARVNNDLHATFTGFPHSEGTFGQAGSTLADYFKGKKLVKNAASAQDALLSARIDGQSHAKTAFADIQVGVKYALYNTSSTRIHTTATLTLPTSKKNSGEYLFEPIVGSGHVALGGAVTTTTSVYKDGLHKLSAFADFHYKYLLKAEHTRTLGIYNHWYSVTTTAGHYRNLGLHGVSSAIPAANALTRTVVVRPGQMVDVIAGLRYQYNTFSGSISYNLHGHEAEGVTLAPASRWFDNQYGMMTRASDVTNPVVVGSNTFTDGGALQQEGNTGSILKDSAGNNVGNNNAAQHYITTATCAGRSDITHKFAAVAGWNYVKWQWPLTFSCGLEYELPHTTHSNSGIHSWAAWSKLSVCF